MRHNLSITFLTLLVLSGASSLLSACNTTEGFGKDLAGGGRAIERSADRNK